MAISLAVVRWYSDRADRDRIRQIVKRSGGQVIEIRWLPGRGSRWTRDYKVAYRTQLGVAMEAICRTGMNSGTCWSCNNPRQDYGHQVPQVLEKGIDCQFCGAFIPASMTRCPMCGDDTRRQQTEIADEEIICLACGTAIRRGHTCCSKCGWSYV